MYHPHSHFPQGTRLSPPSISSVIFFYPFMITKDCWYSSQRQTHSCMVKAGISHPVCRRFHCGPWILSSHSHPDRTDSSSGLRKSSLLRRETPSLLFKQRGQGLELCSAALHQHSPLVPGAVTLTCWGNTVDHQLDVSVYLSHRAGRVHATARGCIQRGTRTLAKQKTATWKQLPCEF